MRELPEIRQDINRVDSAIRELFLLRMSLALEVAKPRPSRTTKSTSPTVKRKSLKSAPPVWRRSCSSSTFPFCRA